MRLSTADKIKQRFQVRLKKFQFLVKYPSDNWTNKCVLENVTFGPVSSPDQIIDRFI